MKKIIICVVLIIFIGLIIYFIYPKTNNEMSLVDQIDINVDLDNSDQEIDWSNYESKSIELTESIVITEDGVYELSGEITDGYIEIDTLGNIKLILNNVSITNSSGPAIYIKNAENTAIYIAKDTINYLEDGNTYTSFDDVDGVIYSADDLILDGEGSLNIKANYQDGIVSKDDLKIINGTYNVDSLDDGIRGKDSLYILNGEFQITSGGDGLKSTNDTDSEKGYVLILDGTFKIEADLDGIQAETKLIIKDGDLEIITGGGSNNASTSNSWGSWGFGQIDNDSAKGLKSGSNLVIENGIFNLDTSDDSIHSNNYIGIKLGTIVISSGDDGIHADEELIIDDGDIDILKSYEGLESSNITINNGNINIVASDDGINVAGGNDQSSMNRPGQNNFANNTNNKLIINNGFIYTNANGDGIDVNGNGYIYGGEIYVEGSVDNGNTALDYDGEFVVNGGTLVAVGSSGMALGISSTSTQYNVMINLTSNYSGEITVVDEDNNAIISYNPSKTYSSIVISSANIEKSTYTLEIDDNIYTTFNVESISTTVGNNRNQQFNRPGQRR